MGKRAFGLLLALPLLCGEAGMVAAQEQQESPQGPMQQKIRVDVNLVQLNIAVTDGKGNYVTGLKPADFIVAEDGISQKVANFGEGNEVTRSLAEIEQGGAAPDSAPASTPGNASGLRAALAGANVFILFDKSNYMYRGFVFAQDAIADFVRSLDGPARVAFYSYSRDLSRDSLLTPDRSMVLRGVRATVAGDNAALYNALLLTLKDARQFNGRKVVVVFSNGPDNTSMVAPEDVGELAQSEGIPIYMISTREAQQDPATSAVFGRMSASTGGEAYYAKDWRDERKAFASIREDLAHLYFLSYYPQTNPNRGWRAITVKLKDPKWKNYRIRTRSGYPPIPSTVPGDAAAPQQVA